MRNILVFSMSTVYCSPFASPSLPRYIFAPKAICLNGRTPYCLQKQSCILYHKAWSKGHFRNSFYLRQNALHYVYRTVFIKPVKIYTTKWPPNSFQWWYTCTKFSQHAYQGLWSLQTSIQKSYSHTQISPLQSIVGFCHVFIFCILSTPF